MRQLLTFKFLQARGDQTQDELAGRIESPVEKHGTDHRLEGICKHRLSIPPVGYLFAVAEPDVVSERYGSCALREGRFIDECGFERRIMSGRRRRIQSVKMMAHDHTENRVAEEFQGLVVATRPLLVHV